VQVLGDDDESDAVARKAALEESSEVQIDVNMVKRFSLDTANKKLTSKKGEKLVSILGETMIAGTKAEKILGDGMTKKQQEAMWKADLKEKEVIQKEIERNGPLLPTDMKEAIQVLKVNISPS
jgi:hypothetical protein